MSIAVVFAIAPYSFSGYYGVNCEKDRATVTSAVVPSTTATSVTVASVTKTETETTLATTSESETYTATTDNETTIEPTAESETTVEMTSESETTVEITSESDTNTATTDNETSIEPTSESETTIEPTSESETTVGMTSESDTNTATTDNETSIEPTSESETTLPQTTDNERTTIEASASETTEVETTDIKTSLAPADNETAKVTPSLVAMTTDVPSTQPPEKKPCNTTNSCDGHYTCNNETGDKICDPGYKGVDCKDRDFNDPNDPECPAFGVCKNGGTCWNKTCCCVAGYEGVICHTEILECMSIPCVNGGSCRDELGFYTCYCLPGKTIEY